MAASLILPVTVATPNLLADDRVYKHEGHEHTWNSHEDRAYRIYLKENHRKYQNFDRLRDEDRNNYWAWRHQHDDTVLKIKL